jgi:hypothetical protein
VTERSDERVFVSFTSPTTTTSMPTSTSTDVRVDDDRSAQRVRRVASDSDGVKRPGCSIVSV